MTGANLTHLLLRGTLAALLLPFTTAASCDGGYRDTWGECPEGETCSAATPRGLHFRGPLLGEGFFDVGDVKTLALGGTEEVRVEIADDDGARAPFLTPFDVDVDAPIATVEVAAGDAFTLRAEAAGDANVRLVDPATGELFDRIRIATLPIARISTQPSVSVALDAAFSQVTPRALYAPGATGYLRLAAANALSLVDTSARITGAGVTQTGWDRFVVGDLAAGAHVLEVAAGGGALVDVPFEVALPDHIVGRRDSVIRGQPTLVCFVAHRGADAVHAAFDEYTSAQGTIERAGYDGCVNFTADVLGPVTVHVRAGGLEADFVMTSVAAATGRTAPEGTAPAIGDTAGERAALTSDAR
jgi:hypothetical protein